MKTTSKSIVYHQWNAGKWERIEAGVIAEKPVSLTVNGNVWLTFMCTPIHLEALAVGFLYNENLIQSIEDVASVRVCPSEDNVDVWLNKTIEPPKNWRRTSGCTGGVTSVAEVNGKPELANGQTLTPEKVTHLISTLFDSQDLYRKVGGVHTTALVDGSEVVVIAEDIGRHNTLDKIAGRILLEKIDLKQKILITTGRISSEMMQKAFRIGAPILITRTSPTARSIEMAQKWGITLIGYARRDRFNVYSLPERIVSSQGITGGEAAAASEIYIKASSRKTS
ncbi:MAG: formate dehydrogenase accessory sulfurtransferase FdhD [Chloroflexi bacterium]|nr:MAG: formate dehydrogenase accessory sulfurtransferase FdhD [Chloroflexota bacterium]